MYNQKNVKIIFHIDMNMFFCSVACIKNPSLKGKAFAIGRANTIKGVISTASYEARKYGIQSGMSLNDAFRIKPDLIIVEPDVELIKHYHYKFINLIRSYSSLVEVASIDECYADMSQMSKIKHPLEISSEIQKKLVKDYHLPCSIGIGPTLFLAKMASDIKKPLGITIIRKRDKEDILYPLSVKEIFGIGKKTYPKLIDNGISTIKDFENKDNYDKIISLVGLNTYNYVINAINGRTTNKIEPNRYSKTESISESQTYDTPLVNEEDILKEMKKMTRNLLDKIISKDLMTKTISITLRNKAFKTITRSKTIEYTTDFIDIYNIVCDLFEDNYTHEPIRLVGVGLSNLNDKKEVLIEEYNLFTYEEILKKENKLKNLVSKLKEEFGDSISLGTKKK